MFHKFVPRGETDPIFGSGKEEQQQQQQQQEGTNLADLILEKIAAFEAKQSGQPPVVGDGPPEGAVEVPTKVVEVYEKLVFLSVPMRALFNSRQGWISAFSVQVRSLPEAVQGHSFSAALADCPVNHPARELDAERGLHGDTVVYFVEAASGPRVHQHRPPRAGP